MKYGWTTILVKDLEKSIEFYEKVAGLSVDRQFSAGPDVKIAFLSHEKGDTEVELMTTANPEKLNPGTSISLGFATDDLQAVMATCKALGFDYNEQIFSPNPTIEFFYAVDPNGIKVQFHKHLR